jgi:hypothetical protein
MATTTFPRLTTRAVAVAVAMFLQVMAAEATAAAEPAVPASGRALPLVIPHPQSIRRAGGAPIPLVQNGRCAVEIIASQRGDLFEEAKSLVDQALRTHATVARSGPAATRIILGTLISSEIAAAAPSERAHSLSPQATAMPTPRPPLTPQESAALARSEQAYVIRSQPGPHPGPQPGQATVWILGASPLGAYYGATTLVQLIESPRPGTAELPPVEVCDYPDIPFRMAADWVLQWDWEVNGYDWGDGLDAFVARCKRKIDLCSRYKVNRVRFLGGRIAPGPAYMAERYAKIRRFALELNRYARRKGVALQYSSSSWGGDYYGWGLFYPQPWLLNRESYPNGRVYSCVGGTVGGCFTNDALVRIVAERHKQLVRDTEPGSLYLHQIDAATYAELAQIWKSRCAACRKRFADDEPCSAQGYAGAVAGLYNALIAQLKSVKNPTNGYDTAHDLEIVFASPGYSYWTESDADWDKDLRYFAQIGRLLADKRNVQITFREQYQRLDGRRLRIGEMSDTLTAANWPLAPFVFAVQGGGFIDSARLFVSSPVMTEINRGAATLYNANGHVHSELQVLANVNYAWNCRAPGGVAPSAFRGKALQEEAFRYAAGARHSEFLYGPFLESACAALYGRRATPAMVALFRMERDRGSLLVVPAWIDLAWQNAGFDWRGQIERNREGKRLVDAAIVACDTDARADLLWMSQGLDVAGRMCELCDALHRQHRPPAQLEAQAAALIDWMEKNFRFEATEPEGGDLGLWRDLVRRIAKGPPAPPAKPARPPLSETADGGKLTIRASSVQPGYRVASVRTSLPTGRDWGTDGGWNDATPNEFPDTLEFQFTPPRPLREIHIYTLADDSQQRTAVGPDDRFQYWGVTALDVEVRDAKGVWRRLAEIRDNRRVLLSVKADGSPAAGVRLRVLGSADGVYSRIVHVDFH